MLHSSDETTKVCSKHMLDYRSFSQLSLILGSFTQHTRLCLIRQSLCLLSVCVLSRVPVFETPWTAACQSSLPWNFPGKDTETGCHFLFEVIFLTQGVNVYFLHLLHWQVTSLPLHHLGSPYLLSTVKKWVSIMDSSGIFVRVAFSWAWNGILTASLSHCPMTAP